MAILAAIGLVAVLLLWPADDPAVIAHEHGDRTTCRTLPVRQCRRHRSPASEMAGQATYLPRTAAPPNLRPMLLRQSRSAMLGAVLALIAVFGLFALSSWHNAVVHDDDPIHLVSIEHDHGSSGQADPDGPIHVLAHATGQWVDIAGPVSTPPMSIAAVRLWSVGVCHLPGEIEPAELLRPPRG